VLLLVLDGMAASNAVEIIGSVLERVSDGWAEALLPSTPGRGAALAALPTLTEVSRASLLTGRLTSGGQESERAGYAALCQSYKISTVTLAHKAALDTSAPGEALSGYLSAAIADTGVRLVSCVLNTIDDALDRSDPGRTEWVDSAVRHLRPLLDHARRAGRVVIMTADHGHVIERRQGSQRSYPDITSARSRAGSPPPADGEVMVAGERVLLPAPGGPAVLAVDERIRFGPLKAGYHRGASPAEVIVPVAVLVDGLPPEDSELRLAPLQEPAWWGDPLLTRSQPARPQAGRTGRRDSFGLGVTGATNTDSRLRSAPGDMPTLFDEPEPESDQPEGLVPAAPELGEPGEEASVRTEARRLAERVTGSPAYAAQRKIAGRLSVSDEKVADLLAALLDARTPGSVLCRRPSPWPCRNLRCAARSCTYNGS
jgi:PglZ domain